MSEQIRVRFAPSPTGYLHIGGARTALFNYLYARRQKGVLVLRLEDTDAERSTEDSVRMITEDLKWLGLDWDEGPEIGGPYGPYRQSERLDFYRTQQEQLLETGQAYYCFCPPELLESRRKQARERGDVQPKYDGTCRSIPSEEARSRAAAGEPHTLRLKIPEFGSTVIHDRVRGTVVFENKIMDDFILVRTNGLPTYNFAAVADDAAMKITHIIRGDDHLSNTPRQVCLYQALGEPLPVFAHIPMIMGPDRARLSKRHGATSVNAYAEDGYLPEAMINYLALLGWAFDDKTTLFTRKELIEKFSLKKVSKNAAIFDPAKLLWMNGVYIRDMTPEEYCKRALPELLKARLLSEPLDEAERAWAEKAALTVKNKIKRLAELPPSMAFYFGEEVAWDEAARAKLEEAKEHPELFKTLHAKMTVLKSFSTQELEALMQDLITEADIKFGVLVHPLRAAITGRASSPGIFEVLELMGQERTIKRLAAGLKSVGIEV